MSSRRTLLALSLLAGVAGSASASAQPYRGGGEGRGFGGILRSVQLDAGQRSQLHQIMMAARAQNAPQITEVRALRQQIEATLFSTGSVSAAQLAPLQQQIETLRQQIDTNRIQTAIAIRGLLTQTQLAAASSAQGRLASLRQQEQTILSPPSE